MKICWNDSGLGIEPSLTDAQELAITAGATFSGTSASTPLPRRANLAGRLREMHDRVQARPKKSGEITSTSSTAQPIPLMCLNCLWPS